MKKRFRLALVALMLMLFGCSGPSPRPVAPVSQPASSPSEPPSSLKDWSPPAVGAMVPWQSLPVEVRRIIDDNGERSPDGRWIAARIPSDHLQQLWLAATDRTVVRLVQQGLSTDVDALWSPKGTYLYYAKSDDAWVEVAPETGTSERFLSWALAGQKAGHLRFSPDGTRLLYDMGLCDCDHPSQNPVTTFVVNTDGMDMGEVGINVDARWDGNQVVLSPEGFYPLDTRTGLPEMDQVIGALASRDSEKLLRLVKTSQITCMAHPSGVGEYPCPEGTPNGTPVDVFPSGSCQPNYLPPGDLLRNLFHYLADQRWMIYVIYRNKPAGYGIIVATVQEPFRSATLVVDASGAITEEYGCGGPFHMLPIGADFLLPPKQKP